MRYFGKIGPMHKGVAIQVKVPDLKGRALRAKLLLNDGRPYMGRAVSLHVTQGMCVNTTNAEKSLLDWARACGREQHELRGTRDSRNSVYYEIKDGVYLLRFADDGVAVCPNDHGAVAPLGRTPPQESRAHSASMEQWNAWCRGRDIIDSSVPLFATDARASVLVDDQGKLMRSPAMEGFYEPVIVRVRDDSSYCGIIYVMYWLRDALVVPLYVGLTLRYGKKGDISANLTLSRSIFGRWGSGPDWHVGKLSQGMHGAGGHQDWTRKLFADSKGNRILRHPTYFWASPWTHSDECPCGVPVATGDLERCLIQHAGLLFPEDNLNKRSGEGGCRCPLSSE